MLYPSCCFGDEYIITTYEISKYPVSTLSIISRNDCAMIACSYLRSHPTPHATPPHETPCIIFEDVQTDLSFLGPGWLLHQPNRMALSNITMWIERQWTSPLQRVGDQSIMKAFINITNVTTRKLEMTNYCRCYLRVITIADLANLDGRSILGGRMDGK